MSIRNLRLFATSMCLVFGVATLLVAILPAQTANAQGEKYTWDSKTLIIASGGQIKGSVPLRSTSGSGAFTPDGPVTDISGCKLVLYATPSNDKKTISVTATIDTMVTSNPCSNSVLAKYQKSVPAGNPERAGAPNEVDEINDAIDAVPAGGEEGDEEQCPINDDSKLRWIICPLVVMGDFTTNWLQSLIMNFLYTPTDEIFKAIGPSAANFRNIGLSLLAVAALFMIVSQAFGFEVFDAYTVKKILPRILIAAVGIAIALPLMQFIVTLSNDIGLLIGKMINAAVASPPPNPGGDSTGNDVAGAVVGTGSVVAAIGALGGAVFIASGGTALGVLALLGTIVLALLVGMLVLAIRQMIIVVCVLFAPVAIAAYILPGTQKFWNFWQNTFVTTLLMFPIIMAFIASGQALSDILGQGGDEMKFLAILVRYAPFFLLPFAFKLAGGLMSTIFSLANDKGKGLFDRSRNFRAGQRQQSAAKLKGGSYFSDRNRFTKGFNRASAVIGSGPKNWATASRRAEAADQAKRGYAANAVMKTPGWQAIQENDDALHAATHQSAAAAREALTTRFGGDSARAERAVAAAQASIGFGRAQAIAAAQQLSTTGTGYKDMHDQAETIARAAGGDASTRKAIVGYNNYVNKIKGRTDLAPGYTTLDTLAEGEAAKLAGTGSGPGDKAYADASFEATGSTDAMTTMRNKGPGFENTVAGLRHGVSADASTPEGARMVAAAKARVHDLINTMSYGPQPNQRELIAEFESDPEFASHITRALQAQKSSGGRGIDPTELTGQGGAGPGTPEG